MPTRGPFAPVFDVPKRRGHVTIGTQVGAVPPVPTVAAFAISFETIVAVDIADPTTLTVIDTLTVSSLDENASDQAIIDGDVLYVASRTGDSLHAVDISDATTLAILDTLAHADLTNGVAVEISGTVAYVASENNNTIAKVDITDPTNLSLLAGTLTDASLLDVRSMALSGTTLLTPIHDVPGRLISVGAIPTLAILDDLTLTDCNNCSDVQVSGSNAFVLGTNDASNAGALVAVDISTPAALSEAATFTNVGILGGWNFKISGTHAFIATADEIVSVDISNSASMSIVDTLAIPSCTFITSTAIAGDYLFCTAVISAADDEVVAIDISDPANLSIADQVSHALLGNAGSIAAH